MLQEIEALLDTAVEIVITPDLVGGNGGAGKVGLYACKVTSEEGFPKKTMLIEFDSGSEATKLIARNNNTVLVNLEKDKAKGHGLNMMLGGDTPTANVTTSWKAIAIGKTGKPAMECLNGGLVDPTKMANPDLDYIRDLDTYKLLGNVHVERYTPNNSYRVVLNFEEGSEKEGAIKVMVLILAFITTQRKRKMQEELYPPRVFDPLYYMPYLDDDDDDGKGAKKPAPGGNVPSTSESLTTGSNEDGDTDSESTPLSERPGTSRRPDPVDDPIPPRDRRVPPRGPPADPVRDDRRVPSRGRSVDPPRGGPRYPPRGGPRYPPRDDRREPPRDDRREPPRDDRRQPPRDDRREPPHGGQGYAPRGGRGYPPRGGRRYPSRGGGGRRTAPWPEE